MRQRITPTRLLQALALGLAVWAAPLPLSGIARAQSRAATAELTARDVERLLTEGEELERARRWGDALGHYEAALKKHPDQADLSERLTRSRIHFDLTRRIADTSYTRAVGELNTAAALELYGEVLLKIHTHHVEAPNWARLAERGALSLDSAIADPTFVAKYLPRVAQADIETFQAKLAKLATSRTVRTRQDAQQLAADIALRAAQDLGLKESAAVLEFACGAMSSLDTYTSFLTSAQMEDVFSQIEGNFVGLGIELKTQDKQVEIVAVIEGSPAERAGIKTGDKIIAVDGRTIDQVSADTLADLLKGPEGSTAAITLLDNAQQSHRLRIVRQRVDVPSVDRVRILDREHGVGYFRITSFQKTTSRDVDAALWKLQRDGMKFLIIDVRGNPGGLLNGAVEIADKFVNEGTIVSTRGRSPMEDYDYKAHPVGTWRVPMAVLIDGDSASASEIFAGAIHDLRRGTIVGTQSYGKGSVQGIFPLNSGHAGLRITTAKFYSPSGQAISHRGVTPDLVVNVTAKPIVSEGSPGLVEIKDSTLEASLQLARDQVSQR